MRRWIGRELDFDRPDLFGQGEHQIDLITVGRPEVGGIDAMSEGLQAGEDLLDYEPFPARTHPGLSEQRVDGADPE